MRSPRRPLIMPIMLAIAASLGGCARPYEDAPLAIDHPANPDAPIADMPARSLTLANTADHAPAREATQPSRSSQMSAATSPSAYVCPMHPQITSDKPDQRCPLCGMKLIKNSEGGTQP